MKNTPFTRILSFVLILALLLQVFPAQVFAASNVPETVATFQPSETPAEDEEPEDVHIVEEITEKRTEFTKSFKLSNGLNMAAVYPNAVHYEENGTWKEIDNTLQLEQRDSQNVYINKAGSWKVQLPQDLTSDSGVSVSRDDHTLRFYMAGELRTSTEQDAQSAATFSAKDTGVAAYSRRAAKNSTAMVEKIDMSKAKAEAEYPEMIAEKLSSRMRYSDIYENTDIVYDLNSNQLKESIIMEQYDADLHGYSYILEVSDMIPVLAEDHTIELYDKIGGTVIMSMPAPYLVDDAEEYCYGV